jgi:hypothetical protein
MTFTSQGDGKSGPYSSRYLRFVSSSPSRDMYMDSLFQMCGQRVIVHFSRFPQISHSLLIIPIVGFVRRDITHTHVRFGSLQPRSEKEI